MVVREIKMQVITQTCKIKQPQRLLRKDAEKNSNSLASDHVKFQ
jgi:hypothetical protein